MVITREVTNVNGHLVEINPRYMVMPKSRFHFMRLITVAILGHCFCFFAQAQISLSEVNQNNPSELLAYANKINNEEPKTADLAFDLLEKKVGPNSSMLMDIWQDRGFALENRGQLNQAITYYTKALQVARDKQSLSKEISILNDLAIAYRKNRQYEESKTEHLRCLNLAELLRDQEYIEYSLHGLGFLYEKVGDYHKAIEFYTKSVEKARQSGLTEGVVVTQTNIAHAYMALQDTLAALTTIQKAWENAQTSTDTECKANVSFNFAELQQQLGAFAESEKHYKNALAQYLELNDESSVLECYFRLAEVYFNTKDYEKARHSALKVHVKHSLVGAEIREKTHVLLGKIAMNQGQFAKAIEYFEPVLSEERTEKNRDLVFSALKLMAECATKLQQHGAAIGYLEEAEIVRKLGKEEILTSNNKEIDFRLGLSRNELALQKLQLRQNRLQIAAILFIGFTSVGAFGFLLYFRRKNSQILSNKNDEIILQNEQLEASNQFLRQFTYAVAHDMKEPLRTINGFTTLLERGFSTQFGKEGERYFQFVKSGVARMHELVASFLTFSEITSQAPVFEPVNSKEVLWNAANEVQAMIPNSEVEFEGVFPIIHCHPNHLKLLFRNLIHNGLKFNQSQKPTVWVTCEKLAPANKLRFSFRDNGIGINPEYAPKVFNLFQQLDKSNQHGGVGMGLTICKNIVEKYNGTISFTSDVENGGSVFVVELPVG